jgi:tRNA modification GTPase
MYNTSDTIAAISSAAGMDAKRNIIRISGAEAFEFVGRLFETTDKRFRRGVTCGNIRLDVKLTIAAAAYIYPSPHSYTGDDVAELHILCPQPVIEAVMQRVFALGARAAEPGEFTARAYLNGKMDLAQAEAVAQIVSSSNAAQLSAAQKLLAGKLTETVHNIGDNLLDLISRIEAGLDFSGEDIEFISTDEAVGRIDAAIAGLSGLLAGSVRCEEMLTLPAVAIAGAPNAGKSSLLNKLLGHKRSIVSDQPATTRDILTGVLELAHCNCAVFDCAGLWPRIDSENILKQLAQHAAIEAIHTAQLVIFCADTSKSDWNSDAEIFNLIKHKNLIAAATKSDLQKTAALGEKIAAMKDIFGRKFIPISSITGFGIESLLAAIDTSLTRAGQTEAQTGDLISLNQRHRRRLEEAVSGLMQAKHELLSDNKEVASMLLRNVHRVFGELSDESRYLSGDDAVLERIFSRFCIGK